MTSVRKYIVAASSQENNAFLTHAWKCLVESKIPVPIASFEKIFKDLAQIAWKEKQGMNPYPSNKVFIQTMQKILKNDFLIESKITQLYEVCSRILGEKSWNVVQGKKLNFFVEFFPYQVLIPTGLNSFDTRMGGVSRGTILNINGSTNSGKTTLMTSLGCNFLKTKDYQENSRKLKVLHVALENTAPHCLMKYLHNLSAGTETISEIEKEFGEQLKVISNAGKPKLTIEKLKEKVLKMKKDFNFDVLIVDLVQNLEYNSVTRFSVIPLIKELSDFAREQNVLIVNGINHVDLRKSPIGRPIHQIDTAEVFMPYNSTSITLDKDNDPLNSKQILHLTQKNSEGLTSFPREFLVNWDKSLFEDNQG